MRPDRLGVDELALWLTGRPPTPDERAELSRLRSVGERADWLYRRRRDASPPAAASRSLLVPVLVLVHGDAGYCRDALPAALGCLRRAMGKLGLRPRLHLYENDSPDGAGEHLAALERRWPDDVVLTTEPLPADLRPRGGGRTTDRCAGMARLRNVVRALASPDLEAAPVAMLLDTQVWFDEAAVLGLLRPVLDGRLNMAAPLARCALKREHYYDTYALLWPSDDPSAGVTRRSCPMRACRPCRADGTPGRLAPGARTVPVQSAFGGLVAVRADRLLACDWSSEGDQCEHVAFCRAVGRVALVAGGDVRWLQHSRVYRERPQLARALNAMLRETPAAKGPLRVRGRARM